MYLSISKNKVKSKNKKSKNKVKADIQIQKVHSNSKSTFKNKVNREASGQPGRSQANNPAGLWWQGQICLPTSPMGWVCMGSGHGIARSHCGSVERCGAMTGTFGWL